MKIYAFEVRDDEAPYLKAFAAEKGAELVLSPDILANDAIAELEPGAGLTVLGRRRYGRDELQALAARGIRFLSTRTIGYNHIDLEAAKALGIRVCNARYAPNGVADYTVMMLLLCLRHYKQALWRAQANDFSLPGLMGREMRDLTVGIVGTGRIGTQVIRSLSGFGCRILCWDRHPNAEAAKLASYRTLDDLYRECDAVSLHVALTPDTYHMIRRETIAKMKDGVILINCARGGLMDIAALTEGIESRKIGALGLDTVEEEEGIMHRDLRTDIVADRDIAYLRQFRNVVHTVHMAFYTDEAVKSMAECGIAGLLQMAAGDPCPTRLC